MKRLGVKFILTVSALVLMGAIFGSGYLIGKNSVICEVCPPQDVDFSLFWETYKKLQEKFVDKGKLDIQKMIYGAISGMIKSIDDPYTVFFDPEQTKIFMEDISGRFEGVGMEIDIRDEKLKIIAPLEGTPAQRAGLRAGDEIVKIGELPTVGLTVEEAVKLIRGPKGTKVKLTIAREGWEMPKEFELERDIIEIPSLKWELKEGDIAYIRIYQFSEKTGFDFSRTAIEIIASPAKKIILDLRNNPGGYLEVARDVTGWFLKRGGLVVIEDFGTGKRENRASGPELFFGWPIVVLINQGTASGAEIVAAALRDNGGVVLIGEKSFGKGSVQELENLHGGSSLKITTAHWLTPKGEILTGVGLEPDIKVERTEQDYNEGKDSQLDKALEIIKGMR